MDLLARDIGILAAQSVLISSSDLSTQHGTVRLPSGTFEAFYFVLLPPAKVTCVS